MRPPRRERTGTRRDGGVRVIRTNEVRYPGVELPPLPDDLQERYRAAMEAESVIAPVRDTGIEVSLISPGPVETAMLRHESKSDRSTMAFVQRPIEPDDVARTILQLMRKPSQEVLLPVQTKFAAFLMSLFPSFFTAAYPFLNLVGGTRLKLYRRKLAPVPAAATTEAVHE